MNLDAMKDILSEAHKQDKPMWEIVLESDMENREVSREASMSKMLETWHAMREASETYTGEQHSPSGMAGGQGAQMRKYAAMQETIGGDFTAHVIGEALAMGESNACMRRIVAAPTAGACGVLPAVLIPMYHRFQIPEDKIVQSLYLASGIGAVIAYRASISGAAGGCQAEVGSASAMAAGALVFLRDGSDEQVLNAVAMALKMILGLVCDPVAGLVEVPCIKRNVMGAMNAIAAADMALAGIVSRLPADEVIDAMGDVGRHMPVEFRETALGGLAATPTGKDAKKRLTGSNKN